MKNAAITNRIANTGTNLFLNCIGFPYLITPKFFCKELIPLAQNFYFLHTDISSQIAVRRTYYIRMYIRKVLIIVCYTFTMNFELLTMN